MSYVGRTKTCSTLGLFLTMVYAKLVAMGWTGHDDNSTTAKATLSLSGNAVNNETVVLDGKTYTWKSNLTPAEGEVKIAASAALSLDNLKLAVNGDVGSYGTSHYCTAHTTVSATTNTDTTQLFEGILSYSVSCEDQNLYASTETMTNGSFGGSTFASGASDKIYKSNGEDGTRPWFYVQIKNYGLGRGWYKTWYYWNASTHSGLGGSSTNGTDFGGFTSGQYGIYGNKDLVAISYAYGPYGGIFGHLPTSLSSSPKAVLQSGASAGTNVTITVDSTAGFGAGRYYGIHGVSAEGRDRIQIASITNGTQMVITNLPRNYGSGAIIAPHPIPAIGWVYNGQSWTYPLYGPATAGTADEATSSGSLYPMYYYTYNGFDYDQGPRYGLSPFSFQLTNNASYYATLGYCNNGYIYSTHSAIARMDVIGEMTGANIPVQGQATSGGNNTLTNTGMTWTDNAYTNWFVYIVSGTGAGQIRSVASNTATVITVNDAWETNPDATSIYRIVEKAYRVLGTSIVSLVNLCCVENSFN